MVCLAIATVTLVCWRTAERVGLRILDGNVYVTGYLSKAGGSFKIDHPIDPTNKYLCHSFVESPDMKNIYDGVVTLDDKGEAEIDFQTGSAHSIRIFVTNLLLSVLPGQISIFQRKYLMLLQTTVIMPAATMTATITSRSQGVIQV